MSAIKAELYEGSKINRREWVNHLQFSPPSMEASARPRRFTTVDNPSDAFVSFSKLCRQNGFQHFLLGKMNQSKQIDLMGSGYINDMPSYVFDELRHQHVLENWSVAHTLTHCTAPFWTSSATSNTEDPASSESIDRFFFDKLSVQNSLCLPLNSFGSDRPFLCLMSNLPDRLAVNVAALFHSAQLIFEKLQSLSNSSDVDGECPLTKRQLECLHWASLGKTSGEISSIVSLSEHTVNHYLATCCKELDCVNRTQAVAQALRLKYIE